MIVYDTSTIPWWMWTRSSRSIPKLNEDQYVTNIGQVKVWYDEFVSDTLDDTLFFQRAEDWLLDSALEDLFMLVD